MPTKKTETKQPLGHKLGRGVAAATVGAGYKLGRGAGRFAKNFGTGASSVWAEIRAGYDEAKAEKSS